MRKFDEDRMIRLLYLRTQIICVQTTKKENVLLISSCIHKDIEMLNVIFEIEALINSVIN